MGRFGCGRNFSFGEGISLELVRMQREGKCLKAEEGNEKGRWEECVCTRVCAERGWRTEISQSRRLEPMDS